MEPRPPRPRASGAIDRTTALGADRASAAGGLAHPGGQPGRGPDAPYPPNAAAPPYAGEIPLVPRQERRRRRLARAGALLLAGLIGLGVVGAVVGNRLLGDDGDDGAAVPAVGGSPPALALQPATPPASPPTPTPTRQAGGGVARPRPTATATPPAETATADEPTPARRSTRPTPTPEPEEPAAAEVDLEELLPTARDVPAGLEPSDVVVRDEDYVVSNVGTEEITQLLDDWGWQGNVFREFNLPEGVDPPPSGTFHLDVSIHRFASPAAASEALVYLSDQLVLIQGLEEQTAPEIGDNIRLLAGAPDEANLAVAYVSEGPDLFRIAGASQGGDPTEDVLALADTLVGD